MFDEDKNKVRITVICSNPEKLRDKLCCKGGKAIQRIEIVEEQKEKEQKEKEPKKDKEEKKPNGKKDPICTPRVCCQECYEGRDGGPCKYAPVEKPNPCPCPCPCPPRVCCQECYEGRDGGPCKKTNPCPCPSPPRMCCQECYEGRDGGPCKYGYGRPVPPPPGPCYDGYGYYGGSRPCYVSRCDYFIEENPQGCSVM